jgi:Tfp pilus assembly protein PilV
MDLQWRNKGMAPVGGHPLNIRDHRRRTQSGGFSQVEAMVASVILMMTVTQSTALFTNSMQATGKAKLRDGVNAAVNADLEQVRHEVSKWSLSANNDGQLAYSPSASACAGGTLAQALLTDRSSQLPVVSTVNLSGVPMRQGNVVINRTITIPSDNKNLIAISYSSTADSAISLKLNTTLNTPAQGWCP